MSDSIIRDAEQTAPPDAGSLDYFIESYRNSAEHNDLLHSEFTKRTWSDSLLAKHRHYIEENKLGFGDAAFHYLWSLILQTVSANPSPRLLEIGVYKGQVISLWALLLQRIGSNGTIHAISPMRGNPFPRTRAMRRISYVLSARFREQMRNADFHDEDDYEGVNRQLFNHFGVDWNSVHLHRGLSTDQSVRASVEHLLFDVIYVDGGHTYNVARADFEFYAPLVKPGGFLIADDAGGDLPGTTFCKGLPAVSKAARIIPGLGFRNIINVGHNCVFQRV